MVPVRRRVHSLKNTKPPAGQAITDAAQARLFTIARSKPQWIFAYVAATLDFFCGLRACEIKGLQWKHINFYERRLSVRRSKTPEHFLFLWHGREKKLDPTRPMTSWRSARRSLRKVADVEHVRFHDGRYTALTRLAEKGVPSRHASRVAA